MKGSVREVDGVWEFIPKIDKRYAAYGSFKPMMNITGMGLVFPLISRLGNPEQSFQKFP